MHNIDTLYDRMRNNPFNEIINFCVISPTIRPKRGGHKKKTPHSIGIKAAYTLNIFERAREPSQKPNERSEKAMSITKITTTITVITIIKLDNPSTVNQKICKREGRAVYCLLWCLYTIHAYTTHSAYIEISVCSSEMFENTNRNENRISLSTQWISSNTTHNVSE